MNQTMDRNADPKPIPFPTRYENHPQPAYVAHQPEYNGYDQQPYWSQSSASVVPRPDAIPPDPQSAGSSVQANSMAFPPPTANIENDGHVLEFVDSVIDRRELNSRQRRRASHNAVERRRRDTISEKIRELGSMIPDQFYGDQQQVVSPNERQHKSVVLRRSVLYMRYLLEQHDESKRKEELHLKRIAELEQMLGISSRAAPPSRPTEIKQEEQAAMNYRSVSPPASLSEFENIDFE